MITTILSDFSRVILLPKNPQYTGTLNGLNKQLLENDSNYPFFTYFEFNEKLLDLYRQLQKRYSLHIFTSGTIQNRQEVTSITKPLFENSITAAEHNLDKKKSEAYIFVAILLKKNPEEILFIDDSQVNCDAAAKAGLLALQYKSIENITSLLKKINIL